MKINFGLFSVIIAVIFSLTSCENKWDEHYEASLLSADGSVELYDGDVEQFIKSRSELSTNSALFQKAGIYDSLKVGQQYSIIVYPNSVIDTSSYKNDLEYAAYCVCDVAVSPVSLKDGMGLRMKYGKNVWVYAKSDGFYIDDFKISKVVKTNNAYVYFLNDGIIPVRKSVYEVLNSLGEEYSTFKSLVKRFELVYFDKENSTPSGYNSSGNIIYSDSVWAVKNKLMDRYDQNGVAFWNMRSEEYVTTMLVPDNEVIKQAIDTAMARVPLYLGRPATAADRQKYEKWIVEACFVNSRLGIGDLTGIKDIDCVGEFMRDSTDERKLVRKEAAMWRPGVQKVSSDNVIPCSNGNVYFVDFLKIPNNVIIYRLKSKFYQLWSSMSEKQKQDHFRWNHWIEPLVVNDAQGSFQLSETLPTMYYHVLTAIPDKDARKDSLVCSVTYDGLLYNEKSNKVTLAYVPKGEYYLRMGFKHSLMYSLNIYFNDSLLVKDMVMYAQGSNFHFDRGSVGVVSYNGAVSIGYPEGYNWLEWAAKSEKAQAYDTDGYQVAVVNVKEDGPFTIKVESNDNSFLYNDKSYTRDKNNITMLMMYHWCLRPTKNNY